jgi:hypothetical protein
MFSMLWVDIRATNISFALGLGIARDLTIRYLGADTTALISSTKILTII